MTMIQSAISFFSSMGNSQKHNSDTRASSTVIEMQEEGRFSEGIELPSFIVERELTAGRKQVGRNEYCENLVGEQLNDAEKRLDDLLNDLNKNWIKKKALGSEIEEVRANINQAKEVINETRHAISMDDIQGKWQALEEVILKIGKNLASLDIKAIARHEAINGAINFLSLAGMSAWTYFSNKQRIDESTTGYTLTPILLHIIPNFIKALTLVKIKVNNIQIEDKNTLEATYRSLIPNLETLAKTVYEEKTENEQLRAESRLFLRLSQDLNRRSCEMQSTLLHQVALA